MIHYRRILELADEGLSIRAIADSLGHGHPKVREVIELAKDKDLTCPLSEEMDDRWLEAFLFPHKTIEGSDYGMMDFDQIHRELAKPGVNLSLLHHEYEVLCRTQGRVPYSYRSFLRHYKNYADKYKATMRIHRKPGELLEVDWAICKVELNVKSRDQLLSRDQSSS